MVAIFIMKKIKTRVGKPKKSFTPYRGSLHVLLFRFSYHSPTQKGQRKIDILLSFSVLLPESLTPWAAKWLSPETRPIVVLLPERLVLNF
jgi:hypothetical protein